MTKTTSKAVQALIELKKSKWKEAHPNSPDYLMPSYKNEDSTSNGLTACIVDFLNMMDFCHAERTGNEGRVLDTRKTFTNAIGQRVTIGSVKRIQSSGQNGKSDISATVMGRSVKIEVKIGRDFQSEAQKEYQRQIENAKGYYLIAKDFQDFLDWFTDKFKKANE
jgi:hypothetical protein